MMVETMQIHDGGGHSIVDHFSDTRALLLDHLAGEHEEVGHLDS
jgi:hypothetical protein